MAHKTIPDRQRMHSSSTSELRVPSSEAKDVERTAPRLSHSLTDYSILEQQADTMAADVMQRMEHAEPCEGEAPRTSGTQRKTAPQSSQLGVEPGVAQEITAARGTGQPLPESLQREMGAALGVDLSAVRIHTDSAADKLNRSLQARAFTTQNDIFFRQGEYGPDDRKGQELLAHELSHVVQQQNTPDAAGMVQCKWVDEKRGPDGRVFKFWQRSSSDKEERMPGWYEMGKSGWNNPTLRRDLKGDVPDGERPPMPQRRGNYEAELPADFDKPPMPQRGGNYEAMPPEGFFDQPRLRRGGNYEAMPPEGFFDQPRLRRGGNYEAMPPEGFFDAPQLNRHAGHYTQLRQSDFLPTLNRHAGHYTRLQQSDFSPMLNRHAGHYTRLQQSDFSPTLNRHAGHYTQLKQEDFAPDLDRTARGYPTNVTMAQMVNPRPLNRQGAQRNLLPQLTRQGAQRNLVPRLPKEGEDDMVGDADIENFIRKGIIVSLKNRKRREEE